MPYKEGGEQPEIDNGHANFEIVDIDSGAKTVTLTHGSRKEAGTGYSVNFSNLDNIEVTTYGLLEKDHPGAHWDKTTEKYWAYSSSNKVGNFDDWHIKDVVLKAATALGIDVPDDAWFKEK